MDPPSSRTDEWLLPKKGSNAKTRNTTPDPRGAPDLEKFVTALISLQDRLEAIEERPPLSAEALAVARRHAEEAATGQMRLMGTELKAEIHGRVTEELNRLAERLEVPPHASIPSEEPPSQPPRKLGDDRPPPGPTQFLERASRVERQLEKAERKINGAARAVRNVTTTTSPDNRVAVTLDGPVPHAVEAPPDSEPNQTAAQPHRKDLNRIGFEQLRELGLSVTQAARLLARRDARGGYSSLDQLDDLLDFPRELIDRLKRSLKIG